MDSKQGDIAMDLEALCEELGLDMEQLAQFASLFFDVAFTELARMEEALGKGDLAGVAQAAHSIKGAALTLELDRISSLARALETNAKAGAKESIQGQMSFLALEIERLRTCFQDQGLLPQEGVRRVEP